MGNIPCGLDPELVIVVKPDISSLSASGLYSRKEAMKRIILCAEGSYSSTCSKTFFSIVLVNIPCALDPERVVLSNPTFYHHHRPLSVAVEE
ncbi:hypothetical protein BaRGS_00003252 [Batillaria attramentaria]|uniref:Uncharacterized protein n=1 Tax=Batillaria attramentaria TaxID=370345 RepID=A0ABD0M1M3_9CAEN